MTTTTHYGWALPTVDADEDIWGDKLRAVNVAQDSDLKGVENIATGKAGVDSNLVDAGVVDCSLGDAFHCTVAGAVAFTFSNPPASGKRYGFLLEVTFSSGAITWPATLKWPNDTDPTSSLATGKTHLLALTTRDGGSRWRGAVLKNYVI